MLRREEHEALKDATDFEINYLESMHDVLKNVHIDIHSKDDGIENLLRMLIDRVRTNSVAIPDLIGSDFPDEMNDAILKQKAFKFFQSERVIKDIYELNYDEKTNLINLKLYDKDLLIRNLPKSIIDGKEYVLNVDEIFNALDSDDKKWFSGKEILNIINENDIGTVEVAKLADNVKSFEEDKPKISLTTSLGESILKDIAPRQKELEMSVEDTINNTTVEKVIINNDMVVIDNLYKELDLPIDTIKKLLETKVLFNVFVDLKDNHIDKFTYDLLINKSKYYTTLNIKNKLERLSDKNLNKFNDLFGQVVFDDMVIKVAVNVVNGFLDLHCDMV